MARSLEQQLLEHLSIQRSSGLNGGRNRDGQQRRNGMPGEAGKEHRVRIRTAMRHLKSNVRKFRKMSPVS